MTIDTVLQEQIAYYRARAGEYDEWFLRLGRYDRGAEWNDRWFAEVAALRAWLGTLGPLGSVLELASGTGWWTEQLVQHAHDLTAVDASAEVIALNRERLAGRPVRYVQADLFSWRSEQQYDTIFFSFWLSHVPDERFAAFWQNVGAMLKPDGRVVLIDSRRTAHSTAANHVLQAPDDPIQTRILNDGQTFQIIKLFYEPADLAARLVPLGWQADLATTEHFFIYGRAAHP